MGQNDCDGYPYIYNVYEDLSGEPDPTSPIEGNNDCTGLEFAFTGEYQTSAPLHWAPPNNYLYTGGNHVDDACLNPSGIFIPYDYSVQPNLTLVSFPFIPNLQRTDALPANTARILTINEQYAPQDLPLHLVLSSALFTNRNTNSYEHTRIEHSIYKHTLYLQCEASPVSAIIDSVSVVVDNTRGRMRYYPFIDQNSTESNTNLGTNHIQHDVFIQPFFELNDDFVNPPSGFNFLNYYPTDEAPNLVAQNNCNTSCFYPDPSDFGTADPNHFLHPAPYSMLGFYIKGNEKATLPVGYELDENNKLTPQPGIKHTYIVDINFNITKINPMERVFYNPEEVEIEADNLIFPSGYTFQTVRGLPPTVSEINNLPCPDIANLDTRFLPTDTDLPTGTYTFDNNTTVEVKPSVYILNAGSKLTIEPCVYIYGVTFIVKEGATLVYYPDQTYGNFNIIKEDDYFAENDLLAESKVISIELHGACYDCRCHKTLDIETDIEITGDTEWIEELMNIKGMVRVKSGAKLVINRSKIYFSDKIIPDAPSGGTPSGIVIEPGRKVIVTNSTLSSLICHNMWEGITVAGNRNLPQSPESNQGVLQISGSIIENTRFGVNALNLYLPSNSGGGIVRAINTIFRNNYFSFRAGIYSPASASYFHNCLFEQTKPILGYEAQSSSYGQYAFAQATLVDSRNIKFIDCTFVNRLPEDAIALAGSLDRGIGIVGYFSDFYVGKPYAINPSPPSPNQISEDSQITGYAKGIDTYATITWGGRATVWRTTFTNNNYGFVGNGTNLDQISESEFISNIADWNGQHVFFHHATNYTVAGNVFDTLNPSEDSNSGADGYGIVGHSTGTTASRIFGNTFTALYQGLTLEGNNTNLQIKCNNFGSFAASGSSEYRHPWFINDITTGNYEPAVLGNQGTGCDQGQTAGNLFNDTGQDHIYIYEELPVTFTYFANGTPAATIPNTVGETESIFVDNCVNLEEDPNACPELPDLNGFSEGTGVGDGSPEALANDIRNNSMSEFDQSIRGAKAVQYYLQQDSTQQQAIEFLSELDTREARTMLLGAYLQQADTAMVRLYRLLLNADTTVNPNLKDYYKLLEDVVKDGRSLYDLTEHESSDFESLMGSDNSTDTYIQSLLAIPRLQTFDRVPQPTGESSKRSNHTMQPNNTSWLYPNPATNTINIASNLQWKTANLYNLLGKAIAGYTSENNRLLLPENLQNGIYIVQLTLENGQTQTAKLFISK